ncbi:hypothetical protein LZ30DRAFT_654885 [Colletotrichum cereale]|nr:hypothetical protein LZ30DRAFT_654885 [Colletotrichum cereale]
MASRDSTKDNDKEKRHIPFEPPPMSDWHTDPYPCTAPGCIEVVNLVGQFMDLPTDYKVPDEAMYSFYAVMIEELKAQYEAMATDLGDMKQKLADLFKEWQNKRGTPMGAEVVKAVARMKIFMAAWTRMVEEIEELKSASESLTKPSKTLGPAKARK